MLLALRQHVFLEQVFPTNDLDRFTESLEEVKVK